MTDIIDDDEETLKEWNSVFLFSLLHSAVPGIYGQATPPMIIYLRLPLTSTSTSTPEHYHCHYHYFQEKSTERREINPKWSTQLSSVRDPLPSHPILPVNKN